MRYLTACCALFLALSTASVFAADSSHGTSLVITDDAFSPATLSVPANTRIELEIKNTRMLPSEFESYELNREKVIPGGTTLSLWIGPLKPGKYKFFDDFNPGVTGVIVVKPQGDEQS